MLEEFRSTFRRLSLSAIGPSTLSLVIIGVFTLAGNTAGYVTAGALCFFSFGFLIDYADNDNQANDYVLWVLAATVTAFVGWIFDSSVSVTRTTLFLSSTIWVITLVDWIVENAIKFRDSKKKKENEKQAAEKRAFIERINAMIGSAKQTKALLAAIERLTQYAPEEANHILGALSRDAERYVMLRANQETSANDVLAARSGEEADQIAQDARALCGDATEMALELLREHQVAEAEERLGDGTRGSELARASEDFRKYLRGLREVNQHLGPGRDESLRQKIDALGPQQAVAELTAKADKSRRLRSGN